MIAHVAAKHSDVQVTLVLLMVVLLLLVLTTCDMQMMVLAALGFALNIWAHQVSIAEDSSGRHCPLPRVRPTARRSLTSLNSSFNSWKR